MGSQEDERVPRQIACNRVQNDQYKKGPNPIGFEEWNRQFDLCARLQELGE